MVCLCDCGNVVEVPLRRFQRGSAKSCGCELRATETEIEAIKRLSRIYSGMRSRCYSRSCGSYENYGARGIKICDDWKESKVLFVDWALKNGYRKDLSIDRIDNSGNYSPSNCRWADWKTQANNKRNTVFIYGTPVSIYCEIHGKNTNLVRGRLRNGWGYDEALEKPSGSMANVYTNPKYRKLYKLTKAQISKFLLEV